MENNPILTLFQGDLKAINKRIVFSMFAALRSISELERNILLKKHFLAFDGDLSSTPFCNNDKLCILGTFAKICSTILVPDAQVKIAHWISQDKERTDANATKCLLTDRNIGHLIKIKILSLLWENIFCGLCNILKELLSFLVEIKGIHDKCDHCNGVFDGKIFYAIGRSAKKLSAKNLQETLREEINSIF